MSESNINSNKPYNELVNDIKESNSFLDIANSDTSLMNNTSFSVAEGNSILSTVKNNPIPKINNENSTLDIPKDKKDFENENDKNDTNSIIKKEKRGKKHSTLCIVFTIIMITMLSLILIVIIGFFIYTSFYYHASDNALKYMKNSSDVKINKINEGYFFDGPGKDKALIFYPGGKVEETSYSDILFEIAKNGIDCFLVKMPFRLAVLSKNKANSIIKKNKDSYKNWYIGGHSLGGAMAASFASNHEKDINGLALLAAYSANKIPEKMKVLSILGSNDKILKWNTYKNNIKNLPSNYTEIIIKGGNHGQFGDYGKQKGDGKADISITEQHKQIVESIFNIF